MKIAIYILSVLLSVGAYSADSFLVVPNHLDNPVGGNSTAWPFTFADFGITSRRYQQVYEASQFAALGADGAYIKEVWFREDMFPGQIAGDFLDSVQINLGVTTSSPDNLNSSFSENIGAIYTTVYGPSPLRISTVTGWTTIPLTEPFLYLPSTGSLLLDIRTIDNSPYPFAQRTLDAEDTLGDSISAVMANDVNATSGFLTTAGLVSGFLFEPIPEPSTWALFGLGLCGLWRVLRRRNSS